MGSKPRDAKRRRLGGLRACPLFVGLEWLVLSEKEIGDADAVAAPRVCFRFRMALTGLAGAAIVRGQKTITGQWLRAVTW